MTEDEVKQDSLVPMETDRSLITLFFFSTDSNHTYTLFNINKEEL